MHADFYIPMLPNDIKNGVGNGIAFFEVTRYNALQKIIQWVKFCIEV